MEVNTNKYGRQYVLIGITQLGTHTCYSNYTRNLRKDFDKPFKIKKSGKDCWWIVHQEIANIKECSSIKEDLDKKFESVNNLLKREDLQEIFSAIKVSKDRK